MKLSNKDDAILQRLFVILLSVAMTPVFAHSAPDASGLLYTVMHPLFSLDHLIARMLLGTIILVLAYLMTNTSQYKIEKLFGVGFAASGIVMLFNV